MNLFLIGYRCSGKTTVGKSIAMTIDWSFVDSDLRVIKESGKRIKDIVDIEGWDAFRRMERSAIKQICADDRQVVATGGDAALIARGLPEIDRVDPDLTLDGLRQVAARVFPDSR